VRYKQVKGKKRQVVSGVAHVAATFNNTIVCITDLKGNTLAWSSAGTAGFKGARKSTPYAAQMASEMVAEKVQAFGLKSVEVHVKGAGSGRESALRALQGSLNITMVRDVTPIPHNGVRLSKKRRV